MLLRREESLRLEERHRLVGAAAAQAAARLARRVHEALVALALAPKRPREARRVAVAAAPRARAAALPQRLRPAARQQARAPLLVAAVERILADVPLLHVRRALQLLCARALPAVKVAQRVVEPVDRLGAELLPRRRPLRRLEEVLSARVDVKVAVVVPGGKAVESWREWRGEVGHAPIHACSGVDAKARRSTAKACMAQQHSTHACMHAHTW